MKVVSLVAVSCWLLWAAFPHASPVALALGMGFVAFIIYVWVTARI